MLICMDSTGKYSEVLYYLPAAPSAAYQRIKESVVRHLHTADIQSRLVLRVVAWQ